MITTQRELRAAFWRDWAPHGQVKRKGCTQNDYPSDVRLAWCDYVEHLQRDGQISEALAQRATL